MPSQALQQLGVIEGEREEAVDHGRDAGEDLQHRLEDLPDPRVGVLGQVDRRAEPERDGDEQRDARSSSSVADSSGRTPYVGGLANSGVHWVPERKSTDVDLARRSSTVGTKSATTMPDRRGHRAAECAATSDDGLDRPRSP